MKRQDVFKSNYLAQTDVPSPIVATIAQVQLETLGTGADAEQKAVAHFLDDLKPMVLNNFNWTVCEEAYGDDSDFWGGKKVEIYVDKSVMFGNKRVGGLRLRMPSTGATYSANGDVWDWNKCQAEAASAGIDKTELIAALKAKGNAAFNAIRDTPVVKHLIAIRSQQSDIPLNDGPPSENDIPF